MPPLADQGMKYGLRALNAFAGLQLLDRIGARERAEWLINRAARDGTRTAARANRAFASATRRGKPARMSKAKSRDLFDLTPDDEQQMLRESFQGFAADKLRKAADQADADCAAPPELLAQANELGLSMLGVPEELGGVFEELSSTTSALVSETLAHGDMGIAVAALAPAAVATAISLYGNADQQSDYLPAFVGEDVPAAAFAVLEPRPLFDPFELETTARVSDGGFVLEGAKALVPRATDSELFVISANLEDSGPALFIVESGTDGVFTEPEPAMGIRASATGRLTLDGVKLPSAALLGEGSPEIYRDAIRRARLAWCAVALGTGQAILDYVIPYVNERVAFGEPISNRQAVAFTVADMGLELEGIRLATLRAASRADQGKDFAEQVAVARQLVADKGMAIGSNGLQMLGGHGFVKEHPVERWYRDLRAAGLMEGALLV